MQDRRAAPPGPPPPPDSELRQAVSRLEQAVQELVSSAGNELSDRALNVVEQATTHLRGIERGSSRRQRRAERSARRTERRARGWRGSPYASDVDSSELNVQTRPGRRRRELFRDRERARIGGVCAGIASHLGLETWLVRCLAVTGMIFMPQIVFPAYWIMYFVMPPLPRNRPLDDDPAGEPAPLRYKPIAGMDREAGSRQRLRRLVDELNRSERRLRHMEGYVTSNRFELDRQLHQIGE